MQDIAQTWGADLGIASTGDLALASASLLSQQRILRRLLTNPGEYIWQLDYGAGLGRFVGTTTNENAIGATVRSQIFKEASVARSPEPLIIVQTVPDGSFYITIQYVDTDSGTSQTLAFAVS